MKKNYDGKYDALNVAAYIINHFKEKGHSLDHLKLQKLLYFVAVKWVGEFKEYPYTQATEKWKLGPVVRKVYGEYRTNGSGNITKTATTLCVRNGKIKFEEPTIPKFSEKEKNLVDRVLVEYGNINSFKLIDMTHTHEPWKREEKKIKENSGELLEYTYEDYKEILNQL